MPAEKAIIATSERLIFAAKVKVLMLFFMIVVFKLVGQIPLLNNTNIRHKSSVYTKYLISA